MKNRINRREFIKHSAVIGAAAVTGALSTPSRLLGSVFSSGIDISVVNGATYFDNTIKAVELLGGMSKFVPKGSKVGLLINSPWNKPGTYTNPDVALAVLKMCVDAGASEFYSIENAKTSYWKRSTLYSSLKNEVGRVQTTDERKTTKIEKGISLKEAEVFTSFLDCDVIINIPIVKNHQGTNFTCTLKNIMGACVRTTCRFFHQGGGAKGLYDDAEFLSQCIADAQLIRVPNLCVVDATEFVTTNGPAGPGEIKKAQKVVAGTNCVSVDAYCATLLNLTPTDVSMIRYASKHGIGEMDLKKLTIKEV
jgi:uncharacterized protein (DUF362 family)